MAPYFRMVVITVVSVALGVRVSLHFLDRRRITRAARAKGWRDISVRWSPFAPGWFGEQGERHYRVRYADALGRRHDRYCKTSVMTGVFWRDDPA